MTKTVSARIPDSIHDEIRDRCNIAGCTVNDFLNAAIEVVLTGSTEFDFGGDVDEEEREGGILSNKPPSTYTVN